VTRELVAAGARVAVYDPVARAEAEKVFGAAVEFHDDLAAAVADAEAILVMTRWPEFAALPGLIADAPTPPLVIDGRRMLGKKSVARYAGIGLGAA
jgi:UDPglucose 6-dehydrogenase